MKRMIQKRTKGQVILLFTLFVGFLFSFAALGFDLAYIYVVKAQAVTATDAAALAAVRAFPQGPTVMQNAASYTFAANFPSTKLMVGSPTISTPTTANADGMTTVTVTGSVDAPTFFARWLGKDKVNISTTTAAARRDRNIVLVLDRSDSLGATFRNDVIPAAKAFIDSFSDTSDQVGLVLFSRSTYTEFAPQTNFKTAINAILDNTSMTTRPGTNHTQGLYEGFRYLADLTDPIKDKKMNELVFFTDGRAYSWPATWDVDTGSGGCRRTPSTPSTTRPTARTVRCSSSIRRTQATFSPTRRRRAPVGAPRISTR